MFRKILKNFVMIGLLVYGFAAVVHGQICTPAPVGLVSWWTADGNALDSRSGNNGTLGLTTFAAGKVGQSFTFNNGFGVMVADNPALNPQNFTIETWVTAQPQNFAQGTQIIASKSGSGATFGFELAITPETFGVPDAGVLRFVVRGGTTGDLVDSGHRIVDGGFHHVVATYDGATMKIFLDGILSAQQSLTTTINYDPFSLFVIGSRQALGFITPYSGLIDEPSFYNRALTQTEIASIFNAGTAGKCKPTATNAPSGLAGWWAGDGSADDIAGTNNGALQNGAAFAVGKVGQGFNFDGVDDSVQVPTTAINFGTGDFTIDLWFNQNSFTSAGYTLFGKTIGNFPNDQSYLLETSNGNTLRFLVRETTGNQNDLQVTAALATNTWHHVVAVRQGNTSRLYLNGLPIGQQTAGSNVATGTGGGAFIGRLPESPVRFFDGRIDEVSLYSRALTDPEIASVFNAGLAGKLKIAPTPTGFTGWKFNEFIPQAVNVSVGDATVIFPSVSNAGITQEIPLEASVLPVLPVNSTSTGLFYDVATSAVSTGSPTVCFNAASFTPAEFLRLRILHLESGVWQDRTLSGNSFPNLCTVGIGSFSPFAIAIAPPTAANVSIGGQVSDAFNNPISRARVSMTDATGITRTALTNTFGYYRFGDVPAGETYTVNVSHKGLQFQARVIAVTDALDDLNFTALP